MKDLVIAVDQLSADDEERIAQAAAGWARSIRIREASTRSQWTAALANAVGVIGWPPAEFLRGSGVELVVCGSAGFENYLGHAIHENRSLRFCNARGAMAVPVAEHAIAQMMVLSRRIVEHIEQRREGTLARLDPRCYSEVDGATAVIVGLGDIGRALAQRCKGLGMHVIGLRQTPHPVAFVDEVYAVDDLEKVVGRGDHVFLTVPGGEATRGLFDAGVIRAMSPASYVYNLSRGSVLDEDALLSSIRARTLAGAALDVFADEPLPPGSPWWDEEQVLITPHVAGLSRQFAKRFRDIAIANITATRTNGSLVNEIDLETGTLI